jgi:hypothetical protein
VLYVICGIMAVAGVVALLGLRRGRQELSPDADAREIGATGATGATNAT